LSYEANGVSYDVQLLPEADGTFRLSVNGSVSPPFTAHELEGGAWRVVVEGKAHLLRVAGEGQARFVCADGVHATLTRTDNQPKRRKKAGSGDGLTAQMPAQVTDVRVTEGERVQSGQVLLVMEAMKMEIRLTAPHEGVVKRLHAQKGQVVERGQTLVELATAEG
jgi:biotin carboxyl carrier protein